MFKLKKKSSFKKLKNKIIWTKKELSYFFGGGKIILFIIIVEVCGVHWIKIVGNMLIDGMGYSIKNRDL